MAWSDWFFFLREDEEHVHIVTRIAQARSPKCPNPILEEPPVNYLGWALPRWVAKETCTTEVGYPLIPPTGYGCIIMVGLASQVLVAWKLWKVGQARKQFNITHAVTHSETSKQFNCVYRAFHSTHEIYPQFLFMLMFGGLYAPIFCTIGGIIWMLGRYVTAKAYYTGVQKRIIWGRFYLIGSFMLGLATFRCASRPVFFYP